MAKSPAYRIGVLLGTARPNGNGLGVRCWVLHQLARDPSSCSFELRSIFPTPERLPPIEDVIPQSICNGQYPTDLIRRWSAEVSTCDGFILVTPQHNRGYPGELKNALDHLFWEWATKPIAVVTYGGHGGGLCGAQLRQVLGGMRMRVVSEELSIVLPQSYIQHGDRISAEGEAWPQFVTQHEAQLSKVSAQLLQLLQAQP